MGSNRLAGSPDEIIVHLMKHCDSIELSQSYMSHAAFSIVSDSLVERGMSLSLSGRQVAAVLWLEGRIATWRLNGGQDVFSFMFSGCAMARYTFKGVRYAAHIHSCSDPGKDCRDDWVDYVNRNNIVSLRMFRPDPSVPLVASAANRSDDCWGLISKEGNCYSIAVKCLPNDDRHFEILEIRKHDAGDTIFDYRPILCHGMNLTLGSLRGPDREDYLRRSRAVTRRNWEDFWNRMRYRVLYRKTFF